MPHEQQQMCAACCAMSIHLIGYVVVVCHAVRCVRHVGLHLDQQQQLKFGLSKLQHACGVADVSMVHSRSESFDYLFLRC
jgi:hypothetical protein